MGAVPVSQISRSTWIVLGLVGLALLMMFVWPTRYHYQGIGDRLQRIDRLNGCSWAVAWNGEWTSTDRRETCKSRYDRQIEANIASENRASAEALIEQVDERAHLLELATKDAGMVDSSASPSGAPSCNAWPVCVRSVS